MGGNLFNLGRKPRSEYLKIESEVRACLDSILGDNYRIPRYYVDKPDFGDLDIIVSSAAGDWNKLRDQIQAELGVERSKSTGSVYSTVCREFQVDYFVVGEAYFETTYNFMSFNDLGNLLGKICRRFNLKYGERGLEYVFRRADEHYKKDLPVTRDMGRVCEFLGLEYGKWQGGFANLEEIFEWTIASPYFSVEPYMNPDAKLRKRTRGRKTVQEFLVYLEANKIEKTYEFPENKTDSLPMIAEFFPEAKLLEAVRGEEVAEQKAIQIAAKFNGGLVRELTGLEGKELGELIRDLRQGREDFEGFILEATPEEIEAAIRAEAAQ